MALFLFSIVYPKLELLHSLFFTGEDEDDDPYSYDRRSYKRKPKSHHQECYRFHASFVKRIEKPKSSSKSDLKRSTLFPSWSSSTESEYFSASEEFYDETSQNFENSISKNQAQNGTALRNSIDKSDRLQNERTLKRKSRVDFIWNSIVGEEFCKLVVNELLSVYTKLWSEHPDMAFVGTQLAVMACVLCKSNDCCTCCCVSQKKKQLKSIKAASAADIYMAPTPEGRRYLGKKSKKAPDASVIKVNKANAREWKSQEKVYLEKKKTGSAASLHSVHSGYSTHIQKYRYFAGKDANTLPNVQSSTQSLFVVSSSSSYAQEIHQTHTHTCPRSTFVTSESNLLKLNTTLTEGPEVHYVEVYNIPDETVKNEPETSQTGSLTSGTPVPSVPRTASSPPSLLKSIHEDLGLPGSSHAGSSSVQSNLEKFEAETEKTEVYRKEKLKKRDARKTQSLTAVMDESGLYSKLVMSPRYSIGIPEYEVESDEPMPEPILVMSTPPPSPIVTKKTKKYHDLSEDEFENQPPAKQPYSQERRTSGGGFFQKIFKNPEESPGPPPRVETSEDNGYAEIKSRDGWDGRYWKRREMSVPVSPKTVKFEDEIERELAADKMRQQRATVSPTGGLYSKPDKYRFQPIVQPPITSKSTVYHSGRMAPPPQGAGTETLDEATLDMLRMSVEPTGMTFSGKARISPTADKLQKSASTSTMNKDGGMLKLENTFTWDADRVQNGSPSGHPRARSETRTTTTTNPDGTQSRTTETTHEESQRIPGKPVIRTTVEGQLKIEKSVGTRLETIDHSIAKAYTIRETVTHYLIRTVMAPQMSHQPNTSRKRRVYSDDFKLEVVQYAKNNKPKKRMSGHYNVARTLIIEWTDQEEELKSSRKREVIIEERPPSSTADETTVVRGGVRTSGIYRLSVYEDGQEIGRHEADIKIPDNMSKPDYLAKLSQKLLADLATLDGEEITATTRVEIERVEDVTDYVKTYLIGQAFAEPEPEPIQIQIPEPEKVFNYESASDALSSEALTPNLELHSRSYVDKLEREPEGTLEKKDIHLLTEGKIYEDKTRFGGFSPKHPLESDTESVESILVDRRKPRVANVFADCDLKRTEDRSENTVLIAVPTTVELSMILRIERIRERKKLAQAAYEMEREGKMFKEEAVIKKTRRFESEEEEKVEERVEEVVQIKESVAQVDVDLIKKESYGDFDLIWEIANSGGRIETYAKALRIGLEREGQRFKGQAVMRKQKRYESEESSISEPEKVEEQKIQQAAYGLEREGQQFKGKAVMRKQKRYESEESSEGEPIPVQKIKVQEQIKVVQAAQAEEKIEEMQVFEFGEARKVEEAKVRREEKVIEMREATAQVDVTLFKKESYGSFDLTIETANFGGRLETFTKAAKIEIDAMGAEYDLQSRGQILKGKALIRKHREYESESEESFIPYEDVEPPPAAYDFERGGQFLEGRALMRRHKKYESETSMDFEGEMRQRGGITHVTLFKKEAEGHFDIIIECPNKGPDTRARAKEIPAQRYENLEFVKSIEKTGSQRIKEEAHASVKQANKWAATFNTVAQSKEDTSLMLNLEKESGYQLFLAGGSSAEGYIRSPRMESTKKSITESAEENIVVMYGIEDIHENIAESDITRKEATVQRITGDLMEYTIEQESCAVMMENRGILAERAQSGWMDTVTGESDPSLRPTSAPSHPPPPPPPSAVVVVVEPPPPPFHGNLPPSSPARRSSENYQKSSGPTPTTSSILRPTPPVVVSRDHELELSLNEVRITKRMHLTNYKSILPPHGHTSISWPGPHQKGRKVHVESYAVSAKVRINPQTSYTQASESSQAAGESSTAIEFFRQDVHSKETSLVSVEKVESERSGWFQSEQELLTYRASQSLYTDFGREFSEITESVTDSQLEHTVRVSRSCRSHGTTIIWIPPEEETMSVQKIGFQKRSYSVEKDIAEKRAEESVKYRVEGEIRVQESGNIRVERAEASQIRVEASTGRKKPETTSIIQSYEFIEDTGGRRRNCGFWQH